MVAVVRPFLSIGYALGVAAYLADDGPRPSDVALPDHVPDPAFAREAAARSGPETPPETAPPVPSDPRAAQALLAAAERRSRRNARRLPRPRGT